MKDPHNIFKSWDIKPRIFESGCQRKWLQDMFSNRFVFNFKHKFPKLDHIFKHMTYFKIVHTNQDPMDILKHNHQSKSRNIEGLYMLAYRLLLLDLCMCHDQWLDSPLHKFLWNCLHKILLYLFKDIHLRMFLTPNERNNLDCLDSREHIFEYCCRQNIQLDIKVHIFSKFHWQINKCLAQVSS